MKKITVITPNYNSGAYIEETINSVLSQNYENLEYIIIDGGSTDGSIEIIKKYEKYLTYWISEKDNGQTDAIVKGFSKATGEILCWLNSDDKFMPNTLERVNEHFSNDKNLHFLYGDYLTINSYHNMIAKPKISFDFKIALYEYLMVAQPSSFWTREIYDKVDGLNTSFNYAFDYDFFLRVGKELKNTKSIKHAKEYYSIFRLHDESKTVSVEDNFKKERKEIRRQFDYIEHPRFIKQIIKKYYLLKVLYKFYKERGFIPLKSDNKAVNV